jgi:hypothetical protein
LQALITIYVDSRGRGRTDILDVIIEHELLHVRDELEVLATDLPAALRQDSIVKRYLIERREVDNSMFAHWFKTTRFEDYVRASWAEQHNARTRQRDSGLAYVHYINRVSSLL